jgi:hypothetical protein
MPAEWRSPMSGRAASVRRMSWRVLAVVARLAADESAWLAIHSSLDEQCYGAQPPICVPRVDPFARRLGSMRAR